MRKLSVTHKVLVALGLGVVVAGNIVAVSNASVGWLFWSVVAGVTIFAFAHHLEAR